MKIFRSRVKKDVLEDDDTAGFNQSTIRVSNTTPVRHEDTSMIHTYIDHAVNTLHYNMPGEDSNNNIKMTTQKRRWNHQNAQEE